MNSTLSLDEKIVQEVRKIKELVRRAVEAGSPYGVHFDDGMIRAAAERAGCEKV